MIEICIVFTYKTQNRLLLDKIEVYFKEVNAKKLRYSPRAIVIDLEPATGDYIKNDDFGAIFNVDNFVMGASGCSNNWAKGRFTDGLEVVDEIMDVVLHSVYSLYNFDFYVKTSFSSDDLTT